MQITAKTFEELSTMELFQIIRARLEVFVVEQNCIYLDLDERDLHSLHVFASEDGQITAYLRLIPENTPGVIRMGRVLTLRRGIGLGAAIVEEGIRLAKERCCAHTIDIEAQVQAMGFYEKLGFQVCSEPFLDDGIPHVQMILHIT